MIVRDTGDSWQVVLQTDHAELAGRFATSWADRGAQHASLTVAAKRHDDGWAVWERAPRVDETGKPVTFLDVDVRSHLAFYRAGIAAVTEQDEHAGLLVSMHGAGIYRQRYGLDPALGLTRAPEAEAEVEAFVAEQEAKFGGEPGRSPRTTTSCSSSSTGCRCTSACATSKPASAAEIQGYRLEPVAPWHVRCQPFPFGESPAEFSVVRRMLPKSGAPDILSVTPERVAITVEA